MEHRASQEANTELTGAKEEILTAISSLKSEFSNRLEEILTAVEETRKDLTDCTERITQAEVRSSTEDEHAVLEETQVLEDKFVDMETRSGLNNLRVVNLPEGAEDPDTCSFLEGWIPEALDMGPLRCPIVMERVRRAEERKQYSTENFDNEFSEP
ncbi:hypothetical protein F7725_025868 [Dissostichus mawsoni]|uniref:Uncharacterized protein n=1 Tax=Dissostichus mawsoni TaxID=36200 RepID=A0A7J5X5V5_DISMA|nr:hypothetical protein F7725_025868 [Dissostichus mawsoni]